MFRGFRKKNEVPPNTFGYTVPIKGGQKRVPPIVKPKSRYSQDKIQKIINVNHVNVR